MKAIAGAGTMPGEARAVELGGAEMINSIPNLPACPYCRRCASPEGFAGKYRILCENSTCYGSTRWYDSPEEAAEVWIEHTGPLAKMNMGGCRHEITN
jgi:hypothetical protein